MYRKTGALAQMNIRCTPETKTMLAALADKQGISIAALIARLVREEYQNVLRG